MAWFKKAKTEEPKKKEVSTLEVRRVHAVTRNAFHGSKFQSCAFYHEPLGHCRLIARRQADQSWKIFRVYEGTADSPGGPGLKQEVAKQGLDFFAAVDELAGFEIKERSDGLVPLALDEAKSLGLLHYRAFAEREGIAFDADGLPNGTEEGEIVTEGSFTAEAIESFRRNYQPPGDQLKKYFSAAAGINIDGIIKTLLPQTVVQPDLIQGLFAVMDEGALQLEKLRGVKGKLQIFANSIAELRQAWLDASFIGWRNSAPRSGGVMLQAVALEKLRVARLNLSLIENALEAPHEFGRALTICEFTLKTQIARAVVYDAIRKNGNRQDAEKILAGLEAECKKALEALGVQEADAGLEALFVRGMYNAAPKLKSIEGSVWQEAKTVLSRPGITARDISAYFESNRTSFWTSSWNRDEVVVDINAERIPDQLLEFMAACENMPAQMDARIRQTEQNVKKAVDDLAAAHIRAPSPPGPA